MNGSPDQNRSAEANGSPAGRCWACSSPSVATFFSAFAVPIHVCLLWPTRESARDCPRGDIRLGFCPECGLIANYSFDPEALAYEESYENSLRFSEFFQTYIKDYATSLVDRYDLRDKTILEIGCGDAEFLSLMCELGKNRGVGFDPSYSEKKPLELSPSVRVIPDYYTDRHADIAADFIVCRQVLEHLPDPRGFLASLRERLIGRPGIAAEFEVPNTIYMLRELSLWDIIYEHCSYFTPGSLRALFSLSGYNVHHVDETYGGQFLSIGVAPRAAGAGDDPPGGNGAAEIREDVNRFEALYAGRITSWRSKLTELHQAERRVALWGAGARGVNFLNLLRASDEVGCVVDANPRKHGLHIAGTGQPVRPPESLIDFDPALVIITNPIYRSEIEASLHRMGVAAEVQVA